MSRDTIGADGGFNSCDDRSILNRGRGKARVPSDFRPQLFEHLATLLRNVIAIVAAEQRFAAAMFQKPIDGWNLAQQICHGLGHKLIQTCTSKERIQHNRVGAERC
jgi:hypothetical protein